MADILPGLGIPALRPKRSRPDRSRTAGSRCMEAPDGWLTGLRTAGLETDVGDMAAHSTGATAGQLAPSAPESSPVRLAVPGAGPEKGWLLAPAVVRQPACTR